MVWYHWWHRGGSGGSGRVLNPPEAGENGFGPRQIGLISSPTVEHVFIPAPRFPANLGAARSRVGILDAATSDPAAGLGGGAPAGRDGRVSALGVRGRGRRAPAGAVSGIAGGSAVGAIGCRPCCKGGAFLRAATPRPPRTEARSSRDVGVSLWRYFVFTIFSTPAGLPVGCSGCRGGRAGATTAGQIRAPSNSRGGVQTFWSAPPSPHRLTISPARCAHLGEGTKGP